jgi:hypothetical protein
MSSKKKKQTRLQRYNRTALLSSGVVLAGTLLFYGLVVQVRKSTSFVNVETQRVAAQVDPEAIIKDDAALRNFLETNSPEEAIAVIKAHPEIDCHQRSHKIGRTYYQLKGNEAFRIMSNECQSGFIHGATEAFFREHGTDNLKENLSLICNKTSNAFMDHQCTHGIGHGLMAFNDYDLPEALKGCDELPQGQASCYTGVFMENVVSAISKDEAKQKEDNEYHVSEYLSDDPLYPCNAVEEKYQAECYFFQSSRMLQLNMDFQAIAKACDGVDAKYHYHCFASMGRDVDSRNPGNYAATERDCSYPALTANQISCIEGAANNVFWEPAEQGEALAMCAGFQRSDMKKRCYEMSAIRAHDLLDPAERRSFCQSFEAPYKQDCY